MKRLILPLLTTLSITAAYGQNFNYDIKYHKLEFEVDPAIHYINGAITTYFLPTNSNFNQISFDFSNEMIVDSVKYNETNVLSSREDDILTINLPNTIPESVLDSIIVYYQGDPPSVDGFGSFVTSTHNGNPILWTLSEPYGAKSWWPCKQILNDKADSVDLFVTIPLGNKVGSNGLIVNIDTIGEQATVHWKHRYPITAYLIAFSVTNYEEYYDYVPVNDTLTVPILNYVYSEDIDYAQNSSPDIIDVFQFFCDTFMIYPFWEEKYGHAQFSRGGGMEHQTMSFMINFSHFLMSHELAHQWFGNYITCGSWEDIWLNEGFAVYLEGMTAEQGFAPYTWEQWKSSTMSDATATPDGSVFCDDTTSVNRIFSYRLTYQKGGMILHQLRWIIGDEAFFNGIRNYLHDPNLAFGHAKVDDLKLHFENSCGYDLTNFFNDWYYGEGFPIYNIIWSQNPDNSVSLTILQNQSVNDVGYFELPIPIKFESSYKDTLIIFDNTYSNQEYIFDLDFIVDNIIFDPEQWILTRNTTITKIIDIDSGVSIILSPNPVENELMIRLPIQTYVENYSIYDTNGRQISTTTINKQMEIINIETNNLERGNYILFLKTVDGNIGKKFIKK
jgi:aminopeptidase N